MKWTKGIILHHHDQLAVLNSFVHRFTGDHRPAWADRPRPNGEPYECQFANDQEWLENTEFRTRNDGRLDRRAKFCMSQPTWNSPEKKGR